MNTLFAKTAPQVSVKVVNFSGSLLHVQLNDGREISVRFIEVPWLKWLAKATPKQRANWEIEPVASRFTGRIEVCHLLDTQPNA